MEGRLLLMVCLIMCICSQLTSLIAATKSFGICYGVIADNLPSPPTVASRLQDRCSTLQWVRTYEPVYEVLGAFKNTSHSLLVGTRNDDIINLATKPENVKWWVENIIAPYVRNGRTAGVIVGNEVIPGPFAVHVAPAMRNLRAKLDDAGFRNVFVTTTLFGGSLANSYPPSASTFSPDAIGVMTDIVQFMNSVAPESRGPLFLHVYPYFAYADNLKDISMDYAMIRPNAPVVNDGPYTYNNLFDAMFDSYVWAMEKIGGGNIALAVGETGWPSAGNGDIATPSLAAEYHNNLQNHLSSGAGTPKSGSMPEIVLYFSLFNEDNKVAGVEQHWGLLYPDMSHVYETRLCS